MTTNSDKVARAEAVGSLLQPARVLEARDAARAGSISAAELHAIEDEAVLEAIAMQESVGLDVITDGELRRQGWSLTRNFLNGLEMRKGLRSYPDSVRSKSAPVRTRSSRPSSRRSPPKTAIRSPGSTRSSLRTPRRGRSTRWPRRATTAVTGRTRCRRTPTRTARTSSSTCGTGRTGGGAARQQGCDYIQLDAPNYGSLCDPDNRAYHEQLGHDIDAEIAFDAELDCSLFDGLDVTGALHVCRGNTTGAGWHSCGGYSAIAERLFPDLDIDVVLLEYDSDRAGDFGPLSQVRPGTVAVLGLLTTKAAPLEDEALLEERLAEAATNKPLAELALWTQCGFASAANAPMSVEEEQAKLQRIRDVATSVWG